MQSVHGRYRLIIYNLVIIIILLLSFVTVKKTDNNHITKFCCYYYVLTFYLLHCVSKNNTDVAHYNSNAHQAILLISGRDVAERVCYQMMICYPTSPN